MKTVLDKRFVADCRFEAVPVIDAEGKVSGTVPNSKGRFYDVGDLHKDAPVGFSLRVNKRSKTYIVQVRQGAKVVTATVGRHPDLLIGKDVAPDRNARLLAAELSARIRRGEDVNEAKREERVAARAGRPTLRVLFEHWLEEYQSSAKRDPRPNTIAAVLKAMDRLGPALLDRDAADITWRDLEVFFKDKATKKGHLTAAEQTIRWVSTAYSPEPSPGNAQNSALSAATPFDPSDVWTDDRSDLNLTEEIRLSVTGGKVGMSSIRNRINCLDARSTSNLRSSASEKSEPSDWTRSAQSFACKATSPLSRASTCLAKSMTPSPPLAALRTNEATYPEPLSGGCSWSREKS